MRAFPTAVFVFAWMLAGCVAPPKAKDWLAVGFQTPAQTFHTYQTGLRADLPDLEYRCLSDDFKHRVRGGQVIYREVRDQMLREHPFLRWAAKAKIKRTTEVAPDRVRLEAEVDTWFHDVRFEVELVREDFWEVWSGGKRVDDDFAQWRSIARVDGEDLVVRVPMPGGLGVAEVGEVRIGREWKIDGFSEDATP